MVSRTPDCQAFTYGLGPPPLREASDDFATIMQLDQYLVKWEESLPEDLNIDSFREDTVKTASNVIYRQSVVLRLR